MFVPKEIAPYLGMIAPMVAPQLGIFGGMALSQLGSIKQHGGKLDPYSAIATGIALSSPQARAIRAQGRAGGAGTIGQQLSRGFAGTVGGPSTKLGRALDPRFSMNARDFTFGDTNYKTFFESDAAAAADFAKSGTQGGFTELAGPGGNEFNMDLINDPKEIEKLYGDMYSKEYFDQGKLDSKTFLQKEFDAKYGTFMDDAEFKDSEMFQDLSASEQAKYDSMNLQDQREFRELYGRGATEGTMGTLENAGFFTKAGEMGSKLAGGIFPGFGGYDPVTGAFQGFDFNKALQTVAVAGTIGSLKAIGEELKKQKQLDEAKQKEIWSTYFKSYERAAGKPYSQSSYPDANIMEKYNRFMLATGGRVGYNMGGLSGGIMGSSGVPQGMQVDGRNGAFIPMGVEEKADDVPAMLSKNEFVMTADAVKAAGDGDANKGAQRMYDLMHNLEAQV